MQGGKILVPRLRLIGLTGEAPRSVEVPRHDGIELSVKLFDPRNKVIEEFGARKLAPTDHAAKLRGRTEM